MFGQHHRKNARSMTFNGLERNSNLKTESGSWVPTLKSQRTQFVSICKRKQEGKRQREG